jgi:hypothetical protein
MEILSIFRCPVAIILEGFRRWRLPEFLENPHIMMVWLLSLGKGEIFLVLISVKRLSRSQGHRAAGRITSLKKSMVPSAIEAANFRIVAQCLN